MEGPWGKGPRMVHIRKRGRREEANTEEIDGGENRAGTNRARGRRRGNKSTDGPSPPSKT